MPASGISMHRSRRFVSSTRRQTLSLQRPNPGRDSAALGATIQAAEDQHGEASALRLVADQIGNSEQPAYYRLMQIAADIRRSPSQDEREAILYSHGTTLQNLMVDGSGDLADDYLTQLETAADDPALWPIVRDDPVGLLLAPHLSGDAELWQYYRDERDWLSDILATAAPDSESDSGISGAAFLAGLVRTARDNHPQVKAAVAEFGLVSLPLFANYGELLKETSSLGVPDSETLEIIFANQGQFAEDPPSAAALINLKNNRPNVWEAARYETLVLRLDAEVPHLSEPLLKQFPEADIAAFLYTNYEDEIPAAASALEKFGDLGLYILNRYQDDPRVHQLLTDPRVAPRAIPFLARFGDQGFEKLETTSPGSTATSMSLATRRTATAGSRASPSSVLPPTSCNTGRKGTRCRGGNSAGLGST